MPQTSVEHQREVRITQAERLAPGTGGHAGSPGPAAFLRVAVPLAAAGALLAAFVVERRRPPAGCFSRRPGCCSCSERVLGDSFLTGVAPGFILVGAGVPIAWVPLTAAAVDGADEHAGLASGLFNTAQQVGNAVALALLATVAATVTGALAGDHLPGPAELVAGYHAGFLTAATLCVLGLLAALRLPHPAAG